MRLGARGVTKSESASLKVETVVCSERHVGRRHVLLVAHSYIWLPAALNYGATWIEPFAVIVVEGEMEYVLSLNNETITLGEILIECPSLETLVDLARNGKK